MSDAHILLVLMVAAVVLAATGFAILLTVPSIPMTGDRKLDTFLKELQK
jgi:hypothetical protein